MNGMNGVNGMNGMNGTTRHDTGFALPDLVGVSAATAVFAAALVPALAGAGRVGFEAGSADNLRTLGLAHVAYALDWNGRQLTFVVADASTYGGFGNWYSEYGEAHGSDGNWGHPGNHPPMLLGWGRNRTGDWRWFRYETIQSANASLVLPINLGWSGATTEYFGAFRFPNAGQFNPYLGGRFYDLDFYAPADEVVIDAVGECFDRFDEYCIDADVNGSAGDIPAWSSYCLSPAAMFDAKVMRRDDPGDPHANGFRDPFELPDGFAAPGLFQAVYPSLKTHVLEHHWLQSPPAESCNPGFDPGTYGPKGCEPYYFNHGMDSRPYTLFYDGHVRTLPVREAIAADALVREMTGSWGLWSQDTDDWGEDGYLSQYAYDQTQTSFHVLTTDGIEGRDTVAGSAAPTFRPGADRRDRVLRRRPGPRAPFAPFAPFARGADDSRLAYTEP